jgi:hypothetical protein
MIVVYLLISIPLSYLSSRYIFGGDSAEFSAISQTWSIPHPPGYPLYSFLANIVTHSISIGTIPWRVAFLSIIPTVLSAYLIFKILQLLKVRMIIAFLSSLLYIVLFPVWEYTLVPEVFALNSLLVISISYFLFCYLNTKKNKYLLLSAFFVGLCIAHHHVFVIFIPGWLFLLKDNLKKIIYSKRLSLLLLLCLCAGVSFYAYAPLASHFSPPIQWEDANTLNGFWRLITRTIYGTFTAYGGSKGNILNQLYDVVSIFILVFQDFRILGMIFIGLGLLVSVRTKQRFFQFLSITSLVHIFFMFYTNFILSSSFSMGMYERFLISLYAILTIYLGVGFDYFYAQTKKIIFELSKKGSIRSLTQLCLISILIIYIGTISLTNFKTLSYIKNGEDFARLGKDIINTAPPKSIYFPGSDNSTFATLYEVYAEGYTHNAVLLQINLLYLKSYREKFKKTHKDLVFPPNFESQKDLGPFFQMNKERGIYLETPIPSGFWMPYGLMWKYYETKEEGVADLPQLVKENTYLWESVYHIPELNKYTKNIFHLQMIQDFYLDCYTTYAKLLYFAKETTKAKEVMSTIVTKYRPSNTQARITLMNFFLLEKNCSDAKKSAGNVLSSTVDTLTPEYILPLTNYYIQCDPTNKNLPLLKKKSEHNKEKSFTSLDAF